ncbi:MAG: outer membrane protein assembly factor BamA [Desulfobacca sp.]|uniref:outer membrane protein assembly factor BamA n=1 Tax=Desulfobacca sp. TaxID=2067990 RepID=UPI00404A5D15
MKKVILASLICLLAALPAISQDITVKRVAVLPFALLSKEPLPGIVENVHNTIIEYLEKEGFGVISKSDLDREIGAGPPPSGAAAADLGKKLGADVVLTGSILKIGPTVVIEGQLIDLTGKVPPTVLKQEGVGITALKQMAHQLAKDAGFKILGQERIAKVEFKGNRRVEKETLLASIQTRPGELTNTVTLRDDLKALYNLGSFTDVKIDVSDTGAGRVVTFILQEKPSISSVIVRGNRKIKTKKIQEVLEIKPFSIASEAAIKDAINKVKAMYREKGFYEAEITYQLEPITPTEVNLILEVAEKGKVYVRQINFEGNAAFSSKELRKVMELKPKNILSVFTGRGIIKQDALERDLEKLSAFYFNHGYIRAKIGEPKVEVTAKGIFITIPIEEGPQYRVGKVEFQGDLLEEPAALRQKLAISSGKVYSREAIQKDLTTLADLYADQGYANADINPLLKEHEEDRTVDLTFDIMKGEKVYFERIEIVGNVKTRDKVIRRELRVYEQDLFSASKIKRSTQNLRRLEFFEDVNFSTSPGSASNKVNLTINVKERPTGQFGVGAGYSTQDRIIGMVEISQSNLFGRGQQLRAQAALGSLSRRYRLSFTEPYLFDRPLSFGIDAYNWERQFIEYTRRSAGGSLRLGHPLRWEYTYLTWSYRYENTALLDLLPYSSPILLDAAKIKNTSATSLTIRRDSRDAIFTPTKGSDNSLAVELAGLGGDAAFTRLVLDSGWYFPLFWDTVGVLHGRIGYMTRNSWGALPAFERFYLGGIDTIRGYKYAEISPRDPVTGERIGGDKFQFVNVEWRYPIYKKAGLMGVIFLDSGDVYGSGRSYFSSMRTSVGTGIRWFSPLGPLRLEWGYNLNPKSWDRRSAFDFSIGGQF